MNSAKEISEQAPQRQTKVAFHLPLMGNPDPLNSARRPLDVEIAAALNQIAARVSRGRSFDGVWQRGEGVYRMKNDSDVVDSYLRYFIVFDGRCDDRIQALESILADFAVAAGQESVYLEIQSNVDVRFVKPKETPPHDS